MAELGQAVTVFVQAFNAERDKAVEYSGAGRPEALQQEVETAQRQTDAQAGAVTRAVSRIDGSYGAEAVRDAAAIRSRLAGLEALRSLVIGTRVSPLIVLEKYTEVSQELIAVLDGISQNVADDGLAEASRALGALARAKEAVSRERALLLVAARARRLTPQELTELSAARAQEDGELASFRNSASLTQIQQFEDTVIGPRVSQARSLRQRVINAATENNGQLPRALGNARSARVIDEAMTEMVDKMRAVEEQIADAIKADSDDKGAAARNSAVVGSVVVGVLLILVLLITITMARSLVRPLRKLQAGALEIAGTRLPGLVDRLRDPEAAADGIEVEPIDIDSTDEIGQVARAFDEVHREAVRLAADEAVLRGNINAMFVNLSRRSQSLIERQLRLIEELEQSERDEEQLANLFRLDHLATRMRRNCENLLVLGGQEQVRRWNQPVPLIDVVRASLSEVEQYERVSLRVQGDMTVAGPVVNDLVHLLAELVENATVFSAEHTKVTVSGQMLSGGGAMLQITDNGVGMSPEELEQANWRLANPPVIDFSAARRMGLFVVGRLAVRHGIRVELRAAQGGGLTAFVVLPDAVIIPAEGSGVGTRGFGGRETDAHQLAAVSTAAEPSAGAGGGFRHDGHAAAGPPSGAASAGTGSHPMVGGTGPLRPPRGATGPQPAMNETGPIPATGGAHGGFPAGTGTQPVVPPGDQGPHGDDPYQAHDRQPPRRPGELPVRRPGARHPARPGGDGQADDLFRPRGERRDAAAGGAASGDAAPGGEDHTGPRSVVPEAQPLVPEQGGRQIPWETGPLEQVGDTGRPSSDRYADEASQTGPRPRPSRWEPSGPRGGASRPHPAEEPAAERAEPSAARSQGAPAQASRGQDASQRVPERSPIFDAMQSEWFMRRTGDKAGEDPARGWESPADAGFRAAEVARQPVAPTRTSVGLPKRIPGKNRVPGAVGRVAPQAGDAPAPAGPARGEQPQGRPGPAHSADVVRNRFASLQRGVHRGRHEARGAGTSGEVPSQGDGETGGTR
ncbi:MAG TPA: nitrate- and nitrite sensing domain-containing protein [Spirillospora sp.]